MTDPSLPDAASLSAAASTLRRAHAVTRADAEATGAAYDLLTQAWPGRASLPARRQVGDLSRTMSLLASELDAAASALQDAALVCAGAQHRLRDAVERSRAQGFDIVDGEVRARPGITGAADPAREQARETARVLLQRELHGLHREVAAARSALTEALAASTTRLERACAALRA